MWQLVKLDNLKQRHNYFVLYSFLCTLVSSLLGIFLFAYNRSVFTEFTNQGVVLWAQGAMFYASIFYPIFLAVIISLDLEAEYQTKAIIQILVTPIKPIKIIWSKFLSYMRIAFSSLLAFYIIFYLAAYLLNIPIDNNGQIFSWFIVGLIGVMVIVMFQIFVYMWLKKRTASIIAASAGAILSYICLIINPQVVLIDPYAYLSYGMRAQINYFDLSHMQIFFFIILSILLVLIFSLLAVRKLKKAL